MPYTLLSLSLALEGALVSHQLPEQICLGVSVMPAPTYPENVVSHYTRSPSNVATPADSHSSSHEHTLTGNIDNTLLESPDF